MSEFDDLIESIDPCPLNESCELARGVWDALQSQLSTCKEQLAEWQRLADVRVQSFDAVCAEANYLKEQLAESEHYRQKYKDALCVANASSKRRGEQLAEKDKALARYVDAMDAIYNHNDAARAAVVEHFGVLHDPQALQQALNKEGE